VSFRRERGGKKAAETACLAVEEEEEGRRSIETPSLSDFLFRFFALPVSHLRATRAIEETS
jgi:hypothetical protein